MPIYLDHSATTRPWPEVIACLASQLDQHYANPASLHRLGQAAARSLGESRQQIAASLGCQDQELVLTSGGSESINLAIKGFVAANPRLPRRIITSRGEHAAVSETLQSLQLQGWQIDELPLASTGQTDLPSLAQALLEPAALISLIHVSNETGAVNPVHEITGLRDRLQPMAAIHLDAVQSLGRQPVHFHQMGVEFLSGSGHKIGAPKGIGWLLVRRGIRLAPQILGGGQQDGRRAGTENPPLAASLARAIDLTLLDAGERSRKVLELRHQLLDELRRIGQEFRILSPEDGVPQILSVAFPGLRGETMLQALSARDICVSAGAACSVRRQKKNRILQAMGIPDSLAECSIRISLAAENTPDEIRTTARAIQENFCRLVRGPQAVEQPVR